MPIIMMRNEADVCRGDQSHTRLSAALWMALWALGDTLEHVEDLTRNIDVLNDHKGDLEVYWRIKPRVSWMLALELGWQRVDEVTVRHYVGEKVGTIAEPIRDVSHKDDLNIVEVRLGGKL